MVVQPMDAQLVALVGAPLCLLAGSLGGVWLGFRICTRDAALLARFATDAREAAVMAEAAQRQGKQLQEEVDAVLDTVERKRRSTASAAAKNDAALAALTAERAAPNGAAGAAYVPEQLSGKERRRAIARRLNGG